MPDQVRAWLRKEEGLRLRTYNDGAGHGTIGYGHKLLFNEHYPGGITNVQADALLMQDISVAQGEIGRRISGTVFNANQMIALVSLIFNCGPAPLHGSLGVALRAKKVEDAANVFLLWHHSHGHGIACGAICDALLMRRCRERDLFRLKIS